MPCGMSWDVMTRMCIAHMLCSVRAWIPGIPSGSGGSRSSSQVLPFDPSSFRSAPPPASRRRDPNSRVMCAGACARGRAFRAGAVCAPDCPRPPAHASRTQGALRPSVESGSFSRRRRRRARGSLRTPPHPAPYSVTLPEVKLFQEILLKFMNKNSISFQLPPFAAANEAKRRSGRRLRALQASPFQPGQVAL